MPAAATAGLGFLFAVLWFDLMFDVQAARAANGVLPDDVVASIATYYRRVTIAARPMNRLVAVAMIATLAALVAQIAARRPPTWAVWASLVCALAGIGLAAVRTVRNAIRLGRGADDLATRSGLARSILRDHLVCAATIAAALVLQLAVVR